MGEYSSIDLEKIRIIIIKWMKWKIFPSRETGRANIFEQESDKKMMEQLIHSDLELRQRKFSQRGATIEAEKSPGQWTS